jgi:Cft2 family RNA processing exonuclease
MNNTPIDELIKIRPYGTIVIDNSIMCDGPNRYGFDDDKRIACYTHIHSDHIGGLEDALGRVDSKVFSTDITKTLSSTLLMQDFEWIKERTNFFGLELNHSKQIHNYDISFKKANHILGSGQLLVEKNNTSILYSSDFKYSSEIKDTDTEIDVNYLILDATHGVRSQRQKFIETVEARNMIASKIKEIMIDGKKKQLNIHASRGTLQMVMSWVRKIIDDPDIPFLANKTDVNLASSYTAYGFECGLIENDEEKFTTYYKNSHPFIRFFSTTRDTACEVVEPVIPSIRVGSSTSTSLENESQMFIVNLKEHATFEEVLKYVDDISPENVIVDNSKRTGNPENAQSLKTALSEKGYNVSLSPKIHPNTL